MEGGLGGDPDGGGGKATPLTVAGGTTAGAGATAAPFVVGAA